MATFSTLAFRLCKASKTSNFPLILSRTQEILAAALGYGTFAALQAQSQLCVSFNDTAHVLIDQKTLKKRLGGFNLAQHLLQVVELIKATMEAGIPGLKVHENSSDFEDFVRTAMESAVFDDPDVSGMVADMNCTWCDEFYTEWEFELNDTLPPVGSLLVFDVPGQFSMEIDEDRPYTGHGGSFTVNMSMLRTDKRCFGDIEFVVTQYQPLHHDYATD